MEIITAVAAMQQKAESLRRAGQTIAFVPTMGYFHEGHLNLMREGRRRADSVVISLYVNPTQFAPHEDFTRYPRDFERDRRMAEAVGVDFFFAPAHDDMYPGGFQTYVEVGEVTRDLCGLSRPRFFRGVATVCLKLFQIVKPHVTIFGRKDYQQFITIRQMVRDLNLDLEVVGMPTTREADGVAMSSRNAYLNPEERISARCLSRSLVFAEVRYREGEREAARILDEVTRFIAVHPSTRIDYAKICDTRTMTATDRIRGESVLALAVFVGKTRLIDNHVFGEALPVPDRPELPLSFFMPEAPLRPGISHAPSGLPGAHGSFTAGLDPFPAENRC